MARKRSYYKRKYKKYKKGKPSKRSKKYGGMQRIRKYHFGARNIGGDRAYVKLRYVKGTTWTVPNGSASFSEVMAFNVGASDTTGGSQLNDRSIVSRLGQTPNLSTLASLYTHYRIRGIKLKITAYCVYAGNIPLCLYTNAQSTTAQNTNTSVGPAPPFPTASVDIVPEQRWARYRVIPNNGTGATPTKLTAYYSVNKVFGPDQVVKNDESFTGNMQTTAPYWGQTSTDQRPLISPWLEWGLFTMGGGVITPIQPVTVKIEATVYAQFWGKRLSTE